MTASFDQMARGLPLNEIGYVELVVGNKTHYEYKPPVRRKNLFQPKERTPKKISNREVQATIEF